MFRTYEPTRDRLVAVKVFRLDIIPEQAQALADELAHAAEAGLFHPSIVEPIAAGVEGTVAYRAEEYVAAESLDVAIRHYAPAPLDTVAAMIDQLAGAIDAARAAGIGHGALHPRDVFVTPDEARVCGFGVVDALDRVGIRAPVRRPYTAPERVAGEPWSTPADVFSLAAIAFELLTGRRPSGTGDQIGGLNGTVAGAQDRLQAVLARAMDAEPDNRFATAREFADALAGRAVSASLPVGAAVALAAAGGRDVKPTAGDDVKVGVEPDESPAFADEDDPVFATSAESGTASPPAPRLSFEPSRPARDSAADDISAERDEDEAQYALSREEAAAEELEEGSAGVGGFDDVAVEAAAGELVFDAADPALTEPQVTARRYRSALSAPPALHDEGRLDRGEGGTAAAPAAVGEEEEGVDEEGAPRVTEPKESSAPSYPGRSGSIFFDASPVRTSANEPGHEPPADLDERVPFEALGGSHDRARIAMLPLAVILIPGLLIAFWAGYMAARRTEPVAVADRTDQTTSQPADAAPARPQGTLGATRELPAAPPAATRKPTPRAPAANSDRPVPALPRKGALTVRSSPAGALVSINGRSRGRTPLQMKDLAFGDYNVRVALPGYAAPTELVSLTPNDASRALSFQLQRAPEPPSRTASQPSRSSGAADTGRKPAAPPPDEPLGPASLEVDSRPAGAQVTIDGKPVGVTPLTIPNVAAGLHVIQLDFAGHQTWTESTLVTAGKKTRVAGSLEPIR